MKKTLLLLFLAVATFVATAQTVHYTRTGKKYHSEGCQYLRQSDFTCSLKEAFNMGLSACSRCSPPTRIEENKPIIQPKEKPKAKPLPEKKSKKQSYNLPLNFRMSVC